MVDHFVNVPIAGFFSCGVKTPSPMGGPGSVKGWKNKLMGSKGFVSIG
jgi:hypothetical protein